MTMPAVDPAHAPIASRLLTVGDRLCVVVVPVPTSLPIPLGVTAPAGTAMLTWAFAGLAEDDQVGPRALLVLATEDRLRGDLTLATHYRDIPISLADAGPAEMLPADDRAILARAILSSVSSRTADHLAGLVDLIGSPIEPAFDAPEAAFETAGFCTLGGTVAPNYLLLRSASRWCLARVASARLAFGETPEVALTLAMLWGTFEADVSDAAIALHTHGFTPLRIRSSR